MLYPFETECREVKLLNGIWEFGIDYTDTYWEAQECMPYDNISDRIAVPSSYNDLFCDSNIKNHVGVVWYKREFIVSEHWSYKNVFVRFGSITHKSKIWINQRYVGYFEGGYTPVEIPIHMYLNFGTQNSIVVAVDNRLDFKSIPVGEVLNEYGKNYQKYYFDFFNYSGIHRNVVLSVTNKQFIKDITIEYDIDFNKTDPEVIAYFELETEGKFDQIQLKVFDNRKNLIDTLYYKECGLNNFKISPARLWGVSSPFLYDLEFSLWRGSIKTDQYNLPFGFRKIEVQNGKIFINKEEIYLKGFGKHEDIPILGRGYNDAFNVKDINILKWCNANSFRTSHYPYAEEMIQLADQEGFLVISETPAVGLDLRIIFAQLQGRQHATRNTWNILECLPQHEEEVKKLIYRDKNNPSVIMWSLANEPATQEEGAHEYFSSLIKLAKSLDKTRPITVVQHIDAGVKSSNINSLLDVISLNRYWGWYNNPGNIDAITNEFAKELEEYWQKYQKPIILTEYGADSLAGLNSFFDEMWSEGFQEKLIRAYNKVLDGYEFCVGEHVWNFADFETSEGIIRAGGNKKGVFTRDRKPKKVAYYLRERWKSK